MTRETKIGLLVGLAFIIVIGILLSDHMTTTNETPQAPLQLVGPNVRQGVGLPANNSPRTADVVTPRNMSPTDPVATREDLSPRPQPPVTLVPANPLPPRTRDIPAVLAQEARRHGEEIVPLNPLGGAEPQVVEKTPPAPIDNLVPPTPDNGKVQLVAVPTAKKYKAEPGDSLSRMASRFLGSDTPANRQAIVAVNPQLQDNPDRVVVGRTYNIPAPGTPTVTLTTPVEKIEKVEKPKTTTLAEYYYTVQEGDNLWRIAVTQLGSASTIPAIKELNKEALRGGETVHPNMKLRMPAKPLASAN